MPTTGGINNLKRQRADQTEEEPESSRRRVQQPTEETTSRKRRFELPDSGSEDEELPNEKRRRRLHAVMQSVQDNTKEAAASGRWCHSSQWSHDSVEFHVQ